MKYLFFTIVMGLFFNAFSMGKKNGQNLNLCYLACIPKDVTDLIASYLSFRTIESDADLKKRIKHISKDFPVFSSRGFYARSLNSGQFIPTPTKKELYQIYINIYLTDDQRPFFKLKGEKFRLNHNSWKSSEKTILFESKNDVNFDFFCSPNMLKVILFHPTDHIVYIIDAITGKCIHQERQEENVASLAVSDDGNIFAYCIRQKNGEQSQLVIKKRNENSQNIIEFKSKKPLELIFIELLSFNKQGTKLALCETIEKKFKHVLIRNSNTRQEKDKKTLAAYFKERGICKNWPLGQPGYPS